MKSVVTDANDAVLPAKRVLSKHCGDYTDHMISALNMKIGEIKMLFS